MTETSVRSLDGYWACTSAYELDGVTQAGTAYCTVGGAIAHPYNGSLRYLSQAGFDGILDLPLVPRSRVSRVVRFSEDSENCLVSTRLKRVARS